MDKIYSKFFSLKRVFNKPKIIKNVILNYKKMSLGMNSYSNNDDKIEVRFFHILER